MQYAVWSSNVWYADLTLVRRLSDGKRLYDGKRPSRATQVAFWEWAEKQGYHWLVSERDRDNLLREVLNA